MLPKENSKLTSVKLISLDGMEFDVDYDCACQSGTIKELLESSDSIPESVAFPQLIFFRLDWKWKWKNQFY